jgi:hypothetical protein
MSTRKRKLTDDEIEAEVLADLNDPSAWDEAIYVPPSKSPRPAWVTLGRHLELSARFHVLSVLHRLGAEATLTNAQPGNVDITVVQAPGRAITIDVRVLAGTSMWLVQPFSARKHHYIAFVLYSRKDLENPVATPAVAIFPSVRLKELMRPKAVKVNIQSLARQLGLVNSSWQQLVVQAA